MRLESLDTPGGHMVTCIGVIVLAALLHKWGIPKMEDLIVGAGAVLFAAMRGALKTNG